MQNHHKKSSTINTYVEFILLLSMVFLIRTFGFGLYQVPTGSMETTMLVGERFFADKLTYLFRAPRQGEVISFNDPEYTYSKNNLMALFEQYVMGPQNWTKRVIAGPNSTVRGTIEDGKPVVYVDGKKLDEPYINSYPLLYVWKEDPQSFIRNIEQELQVIMRNNFNQQHVQTLLYQRYENYITSRSYDPTKPYDQQPFYRMYSERILTPDGQPRLVYPGTPLHAKQLGSSAKKRSWNGSDEFYVELGPDEYWCMGDNRLGSHDSRFFGPVKGKYIHGRIVFLIWSIDSDESWWIVDLIKHPIDFWTRLRFNRFFKWIH